MRRFIRPLLLIIAVGRFVVSCSDNSGSDRNNPPLIDSVVVADDTVYQAESARLRCFASDPDGDSLIYRWSSLGDVVFSPIAEPYSAEWRILRWLTSADTLSRVITVQVIAGSDTASATSAPIVVFDGDLWNDTGEPFIDEPDEYGEYNHAYDPGEWYFDLPTSFNTPFVPRTVPSYNNRYNPPNGYFDEYELFTYFVSADSIDGIWRAVGYTWDPLHGDTIWMNMPTDSAGIPGYLRWIEDRSTWTDRGRDGIFDMPIE